jgi:hypothetical protein
MTVVLVHYTDMTVVLVHYTDIIGVPKLHCTDKCTLLHHPADMTGVLEYKTYSHTKHTNSSLYIFASCLDDGYELLQNV